MATYFNGEKIGVIDLVMHKVEKESEDGVCNNAIESPIVDLKISGNSIQDGTPTPTNPIEIESVGDKTKNLFKLPNSGSQFVNLLENGLESLSNGRCVINMTIPDLKVGKTYTCKVVKENIATGSSGQIIYTDGTNNLILSFVGDSTTRTFTLVDGVEYNQLWLYGANTKYLDIMIVEGEYTADTFPEYEPYGYKVPIKVNSTTTNIYLNEPLRKLGNYADYIDYKNKKVYRIISKGQINDSSKLSTFSAVTDYSVFFVDQQNLMDYEDEYKYNPPILSESFKFCACSIGNSNSFWTANYEIGSSVTATYKRICFSLPNTITSTTMAIEWLMENPIDYIYIANAFVEESIDIPEISTTDGTNVFSVGTKIEPTELDVTYFSGDYKIERRKLW